MSLPSVEEITNRYLYGQSTTPTNKIDDAFIRDPIAPGAFGNTVTISMSEFMSSTGPGRFALGAEFSLVHAFYSASSIPTGTYSIAQMQSLLGLDNKSDKLSLQQFMLRDGTDDYGERSYIYGDDSFTINQAAQFVVSANGGRTISDFSVRPFDDNFDFSSSNPLIEYLEDPTLKAAIDPSDIGQTVEIKFTDDVTTRTYDITDLTNEQQIMSGWSGLSLALNSDVADIALQLWLNNGPTQFLYQLKPIVYGTTDADDLDPSDVQGSTWADINGVPTIDDSAYEGNGVVLLGGKGDDTLRGGEHEDDLLGGDGKDLLGGGDGADSIVGGLGADTIIGGDGADVIAGKWLFAFGDEPQGDDDGDTLIGGAGDDSIYGGDGDDFLYGGTGNDLLLVDDTNHPSGHTTLLGGSGQDILYGGRLADTLIGSDDTTADYIHGGGGDDLIVGGSGDQLFGEAGNDTIYAAGASMWGGDGNDTIYAVGASIWGGDGDDTLVVLGGTSQVSAGNGADTVIVNPGSNVTVYSTSWSTLTLIIGDQTVKGEYFSASDLEYIANIGAGYTAEYTQNGILISGPSTTILLAGPYDLTVASEYDEDFQQFVPIVGNGKISAPHATSIPAAIQAEVDGIINFAHSFPETVGGGGGNSHSGTAGDDTIDASSSASNDSYDGAGGTNTISYLATALGVNVNLGTGQATGQEIGVDALMHFQNATGGSGADTLTGDTGANVLEGKAGNDAIDGGLGNDTLYGDDGNDTVSGGNGNDTVYGWNGDDSLSGGAGADYIGGDDGNDTIDGGDDNDTVYGWNGNDSLAGGAGNDVLSGESGNDTLEGGAGADTIDGGTGVDLLSYLGSSAGVSVNLKPGGYIAGGDASGDVLSNIENVSGSQFNDNLTGDSFGNKLYGNAGNDTLNGGTDDASTTVEGADTGNDTIYGGDGNDVIDGKDGSDWVYGDAGNDTVRGGTGNDTVYGGEGSDSINGQAGNDVLYGMAGGDGSNNTGNDTIYGGDGDDTVTGSGGNDSVNGENGNDYVDGKDGNDLVYGGYGNDSVYGGIGEDTIYGGADDDYVSGQGGNDTIYGQEGNDYIDGGDGDDLIYGDSTSGASANDTLIGSGGNDTIIGGGGDDRLTGKGGADSLTGGTGNDTFIFLSLSDSTATSQDVITDFSKGADKIDFSGISVIASMSDLTISLSGGNTHIVHGSFDLELLGDYTQGANALAASDFVF